MAAGIEKPAAAAISSGWLSLRRSRFAARLPRYLASAVLVLFFALGLRSVFVSPQPESAPEPPAVEVDAPAEDLALQFARAYLSYDAQRPEARERALAALLPSDVDADGGLLALRGAQRVLWAQVASRQAAVAGGQLITVAAGVDSQEQPLYVAVPVRRSGAGVAIAGHPSFVGAPSLAPAAQPVREPVEDRAVVAVAERVVRNYLSGQAANLTADLAPQATVTLPTLRLAVRSVGELAWAAGPGSRAVLAPVEASDARGNSYSLTYELGIAYRERPYVDFVAVIPTGT